MNAKLLALSLLASASLTAAAQSSVALSGVADSAVRNVSNQGRGSLSALVSGSNSTSRLIVRGTEDLGGGLSAGFHLEHGILLDSGSAAQATQFWDRRATVSLMSKAVGEVRLGRDFVPSYTNWSRYDPFGYVGIAGANNFVSATPLGPIRNTFAANPNTTVRSSNAFQYFLPSGLWGLEGSALYAPQEGGTAAAGQAKTIGVRLGWSAAIGGVSVAHTTSENDLTTTTKFNDSAVGGNLAFGGVRLSAAWRQFRQGNARQTMVLAGVVVPVGSGEIKASYVRANLGGRVGTAQIHDNDADQIALGYVHNLSRRSALYAHAARIDNQGAATFVIPGGPAGIAGGKKSTGCEAGIRHTF